jgi:hypothetical protein
MDYSRVLNELIVMEGGPDLFKQIGGDQSSRDPQSRKFFAIALSYRRQEPGIKKTFIHSGSDNTSHSRTVLFLLG